eukprot:scaffold42382_cov59-Phaeocystis_antarctica.AAC.1
MPPRRTALLASTNTRAPGAAHPDRGRCGVVEIGPVGPATQKEVAPAQANTSRKRDAAKAAAQPAAARRAARGHATAARDLTMTGSQLRQPHHRTAAAGSSSRLPTPTRRSCLEQDRWLGSELCVLLSFVTCNLWIFWLARFERKAIWDRNQTIKTRQKIKESNPT